MKLKSLLPTMSLSVLLWASASPVLAEPDFAIECSNSQVLLCDFEEARAKEEVLEFPGVWQAQPDRKFSVKASRQKGGYELVFYPQKGHRVTRAVPFESEAGRALKALWK